MKKNVTKVRVDAGVITEFYVEGDGWDSPYSLYTKIRRRLYNSYYAKFNDEIAVKLIAYRGKVKSSDEQNFPLNSLPLG